jgi:hypothetical protein
MTTTSHWPESTLEALGDWVSLYGLRRERGAFSQKKELTTCSDKLLSCDRPAALLERKVMKESSSAQAATVRTTRGGDEMRKRITWFSWGLCRKGERKTVWKAQKQNIKRIFQDLLILMYAGSLKCLSPDMSFT